MSIDSYKNLLNREADRIKTLTAQLAVAVEGLEYLAIYADNPGTQIYAGKKLAKIEVLNEGVRDE